MSGDEDAVDTCSHCYRFKAQGTQCEWCEKGLCDVCGYPTVRGRCMACNPAPVVGDKP